MMVNEYLAQGGVNISGGMVYNDPMNNALIVPVKVLKDHKTIVELGVLGLRFHLKQPWIFSAGADNDIIVWS